MTNIPGTRHRLQNRHGVKMNIWVDGNLTANAPVAFVLHGFSGNAKQPHVQAMAEAFRRNGYITVSIDATNSFNTSGGTIEQANWTNHMNDLADTVAWARTQPWFREPFAITGQSMGGGAVLSYAAQNPDKVRLLVPVATLVSKDLYIKAMEQNDPQHLKNWRENGHFTIMFNGKAHKRLWDHIEKDYAQYDMLKHASKLTMPTLLVAGEIDTLTPPWAHKALFDVLPGPKAFHTIKGAHHCFEQHEHELTAIMAQWIRKQDEKTLRQNRRPFDLG
ncbi:MAG: lysophospholipase [Alphaproteobacteria bacterium]|nr:lysophospholipase [Alphaproteobacteria bacterium]